MFQGLRCRHFFGGGDVSIQATGRWPVYYTTPILEIRALVVKDTGTQVNRSCFWTKIKLNGLDTDRIMILAL